MKPYRDFDGEMKRQFGKKLYRLSLNGGLGCPNREGGFGGGGCIFCSEGGSGDFAAGRGRSVTEQLAEAKALVAGKLPKRMPYGCVAYFQAYTGTYGSVSKLEAMFLEAMEDREVEALSIATRPDCRRPSRRRRPSSAGDTRFPASRRQGKSSFWPASRSSPT